MIVKPWGKKSKTPDRLPRLEQWLEENPGDYPEPFQITRINKSQAYECFIFRCEYQGKEAFVVQLFENNPQFEQFQDDFKELREANTPLYIQITDTEWRHWDFATIEGEACNWTRSNNGFEATLAEKAG